MNEGKRGFKNKKHVVSMDKVKQRNPVAKNATAGIGGGAAGAHDAKKHTRKEKHKKTPADMMEGAEYSRSLELKLQIALVESAIMERDPAAYAAAARRSIFQNIGAGAMRDPSDPIRVKADRAIANRERGLERQRARFDARQAAQPAAPAPDVEKMKATLAKLEIEFDKLGGDSYQYADRMTDRDREARDIHQRILSLRGAIERAGSKVAEARANTASARASLERRKTKAPLTPEEQRAKDAAKFEKWKAKNQKPEKVAENDLRNPKLVWGPGVRNEVDPEGRSTKFVPKTGTYRVHTGAVGPDQVKQDIKQRIKKGGIAGPKHRLPKE